jgi:hypothetical protein
LEQESCATTLTSREALGPLGKPRSIPGAASQVVAVLARTAAVPRCYGRDRMRHLTRLCAALLAVVGSGCDGSGETTPSGGSGGEIVANGGSTSSNGGSASSSSMAGGEGGGGVTSNGGAMSATGGSSAGGAAEGGNAAGGNGEGGGAQVQPEVCALPSMPDLYPGFFPANPYGDLLDADACVSQPHDVVIVLGCPNQDDGTPAACQTERADIAAQLMTDGYADQFITTGAAVQNQYIEAETLRDLLMERGVPSSSIFLDPLAEHTDENLYYATQIMLEHGWRSALVVSEDAGHLVNTAVCDSNCCVDLGRLTIVELPPSGVKLGHYALYPEGQQVAPAECYWIEQPFKLMCTNLSTRKACKDNFQL